MGGVALRQLCAQRRMVGGGEMECLGLQFVEVDNKLLLLLRMTLSGEEC